jgi:hypothetical protein
MEAPASGRPPGHQGPRPTHRRRHTGQTSTAMCTPSTIRPSGRARTSWPAPDVCIRTGGGSTALPLTPSDHPPSTPARAGAMQASGACHRPPAGSAGASGLLGACSSAIDKNLPRGGRARGGTPAAVATLDGVPDDQHGFRCRLAGGRRAVGGRRWASMPSLPIASSRSASQWTRPGACGTIAFVGAASGWRRAHTRELERRMDVMEPPFLERNGYTWIQHPDRLYYGLRWPGTDASLMDLEAVGLLGHTSSRRGGIGTSCGFLRKRRRLMAGTAPARGLRPSAAAHRMRNGRE